MALVRVFSDLHLEFESYVITKCVNICSKNPTKYIILAGDITNFKKREILLTNLITELKKYFDNPFVLTLNSATSGLILALKLLREPDLDIGWKGFNYSTDIVLTPALTCFATTASILANSANLEWLDIDPKTMNINYDD